MKQLRHIIISLVLLISGQYAMSQYNFDYDTYYSDHYAGLLEELNVVRNINGGTVFKIDYEGIWNNQMKGAFEYAYKIWEEQLPQSMPIKLRQKLGFYRSLKALK